MCAVQAQLVGAPGFGTQLKQCSAVLFFQHPVVAHGLAPVLVVCHLARTVVEVGAQRQVDGTLAWGVSRQIAFDEGQIAFLDHAVFKHPLQLALCVRVLGYDKQTACGLVQTVNAQCSGTVSEVCVEQFNYR